MYCTLVCSEVQYFFSLHVFSFHCSHAASASAGILEVTPASRLEVKGFYLLYCSGRPTRGPGLRSTTNRERACISDTSRETFCAFF